MGSEEEQQADLFDDDFDRPRVFRCIAGAYIGTFNRRATQAGNDEDSPVIRLSAFMDSEAEASVALASGVWPPIEPQDVGAD